MDLRKSFITLRREELSALECKIKRLLLEKEKMVKDNESLSLENQQLKRLIPNYSNAKENCQKHRNPFADLCVAQQFIQMQIGFGNGSQLSYASDGSSSDMIHDYGSNQSEVASTAYLYARKASINGLSQNYI